MDVRRRNRSTARGGNSAAQESRQQAKVTVDDDTAVGQGNLGGIQVATVAGKVRDLTTQSHAALD